MSRYYGAGQLMEGTDYLPVDTSYGAGLLDSYGEYLKRKEERKYKDAEYAAKIAERAGAYTPELQNTVLRPLGNEPSLSEQIGGGIARTFGSDTTMGQPQPFTLPGALKTKTQIETAQKASERKAQMQTDIEKEQQLQTQGLKATPKTFEQEKELKELGGQPYSTTTLYDESGTPKVFRFNKRSGKLEEELGRGKPAATKNKRITAKNYTDSETGEVMEQHVVVDESGKEIGAFDSPVPKYKETKKLTPLEKERKANDLFFWFLEKLDEKGQEKYVDKVNKEMGELGKRIYKKETKPGEKGLFFDTAPESMWDVEDIETPEQPTTTTTAPPTTTTTAPSKREQYLNKKQSTQPEKVEYYTEKNITDTLNDTQNTTHKTREKVIKAFESLGLKPEPKRK